MTYPIYRAESKENFERLLRQDERNDRFLSGAEQVNADVSSEPDHFIDHYYVVEDLQVQRALQLREYGTFEEAYYYTTASGYEFLITADGDTVWADCTTAKTSVSLYGAYLTTSDLEQIVEHLALSISE